MTPVSLNSSPFQYEEDTHSSQTVKWAFASLTKTCWIQSYIFLASRSDYHYAFRYDLGSFMWL